MISDYHWLTSLFLYQVDHPDLIIRGIPPPILAEPSVGTLPTFHRMNLILNVFPGTLYFTNGNNFLPRAQRV